ANHPDWWVARL
ncbi:hypothetical protein MKD33_21010, partial [Chromobacterium piscinae]